MQLRGLEQDHRQDNYHAGLLARCITECGRCASEIQQLVDKMERCVARYDKVGGRIYTAFKDREIKRLLDDLERTKCSLVLAYMMYLNVEVTQRAQSQRQILSDFQAQIAEVNASTIRQLALLLESPISPHPRTTTTGEDSSITSTVNDSAQMINSRENVIQIDHYIPTKQIKQKKPERCLRISFRLPLWLYSGVWELAMSNSQCGWNVYLCTYNCVPLDSSIFRYCQNGDIDGVQRLIENGQGSPLDVSYYRGHNRTLIEVSAQDFKMC
jgi:hypothetical protein